MYSAVELDSIIDVISRVNKIGIFTHVSPDGDAVGSSLALYLGLKSLKKDVSVIVDEYSRCFDFLSGVEEIRRETDEVFDLAVAVDCSSQARLYDPLGSFHKSLITASIDHHASNTYFAKYNYVEDKSPATCKSLIQIFKRLNISISKEIGECMIAGIITDSGGFRYKTVDDETFEFAASMLDVGVDISDIYYKTFDAKTKAQFQLMSIANNRLKFYDKGKIAVTYITLEDMKKTQALVGDHEGIVNVGMNIQDVLISIFLREDSKDSYRVSFRSRDEDIDVSQIAEKFDGGGHPQASGCTICGELDKVIKDLIKEARKEI